jgi:uncharacterized protein (TIGR02145 family)
MEPTIYKPSIYKGAGIYKTGAEGGGGGVPDGYELIGDKVYRTTTINGQIWLAENLDFVFDGVTYGNAAVSNNPQCNYYGNDSKMYGRQGLNVGLLYNFYAVKLLEANINDLCPGWRIPKVQDFADLVNYIGLYNSSQYVRSKANWNTTDGTDNYGFSMFGTGSMNISGTVWGGIKEYGYLWTCEQTNANDAKYYVFHNTEPYIYQDSYSKRNQYSLRLIKDE